MFALENCVDPSRRSICKYSHVRHRAVGSWSKQICLTERLFYKEIFLEAGEMGNVPPSLVVTLKDDGQGDLLLTWQKCFVQRAELKIYATISLWLRVLIKFDPASLDLVCGRRVITWKFSFGKSCSLVFFELILKLWKSDQGWSFDTLWGLYFSWIPFRIGLF